MNFNKPELRDHYAAVLRILRGWVTLLARWLEDATPENTPAGAKRWSEANKRFERFDGAAWQPLAKRYRINVDQLDGRDAGNGDGQIPVSNGKLNQNLNAEKLGGQAAEYYARSADMPTRVAKAGDVMTGPLILSEDAGQPLQAVSKQQLDEVQRSATPADRSVTEPKLADFAVSTRTLEDQVVTTDKIAQQAVHADHLARGAVQHEQLGYQAVWTHHLADRSVTQAKLAADANAGKADRGAACPYNSGIWAFGWLPTAGENRAGPPLDLPDPWVVTGLQGSWLTNDRLYSVCLRARTLRNQ